MTAIRREWQARPLHAPRLWLFAAFMLGWALAQVAFTIAQGAGIVR